MQWKHLTAALAAVAAAACQSPAAPRPVAGAGASGSSVLGAPPGTMGGGQYLLTTGAGALIDAAFNFNAVQTGNGGAAGNFFQTFIFQGELVEFRGRVTCVTVDAVNRRAWVGGVVTVNDSTHASFTTPRTQPGRDVWFRVLDGGEGAGATADRTTIFGFEGDRGIITSAEYCATQPWVDGNVATHAVTNGNIQVRP